MAGQVVMVKKANGKWKMFVDFMNLNKACPKDSYPFSQVDILVDSIARHQLLSFMDTFPSYKNWTKLTRRKLCLSPAKASSAVR